MARVATDVGGTFTDSVLFTDSGELEFQKSPSTPTDFSKGILDCLARHDFDLADLESMIHGSTVVINAVIERKGAEAAFITTEGFRDILIIQRHNRPEMYNIKYQKPDPIPPRHLQLAVPERMTARGDVLKPLDEDKARETARYLRKQDAKSIAVCFLHSYANPDHELRMREILVEECPDADVTLSYDVLREYREFERASSTVISAFTKPIVRRYIDALEESLHAKGSRGQLFIMNSSGGMMTTAYAKSQPVHMVESGPAAGIIGAVELGKTIGVSDLISFDMGGTTVKASLVKDGMPSVVREYRIGKNHPIALSVLDIIELGAGGGSIAWLDESGILKVGPRSAGADPGPVCYGWGGTEPTLTDANVVLGRFNADNFWGGELKLDRDAALRAITKIGDQLEMDPIDVAAGIADIVADNMKSAVRIVSVERGHDAREFTLMGYGGSGPAFATRIARELAIPRVIIPFTPANFSAWGMLMTDIRYDRSQTYVRRVGDADPGALEALFESMEQEVSDLLENDGVPMDKRHLSRRVNMRYWGQEHTIEVPTVGHLNAAAIDSLCADFDVLHEQAFRQAASGDPKEITAVRLTAVGIMEKPEPFRIESGTASSAHAQTGTRPVYLTHDFVDLPVYDRSLFKAQNRIEGPAILEEATSVTILWGSEVATVDSYGNLDIDLTT